MISAKRQLKLMAEYDSWPLWDENGNVDPADLPISTALRDALYDWERRYDETLDNNDPKRSGFRTRESEEAFNADGRSLFERLKRELGEAYSVTIRLY